MSLPSHNNTEGFLNGNLQGVRAGSSLALQENWPGFVYSARAASFF